MESMNRMLAALSFHFPIRTSERKSEAKAGRAWNCSTVRLAFEAPFKFESENGGSANHVQASPVVTCELTHHKRTEYIKWSPRDVNN